MIGLDDLCLATGGQLYGEAATREFTGISDDPGRLKPGELFIVGTLPECGQEVSIERAVAAGAAGLLCEGPPAREIAAVTTILVGDARLALEQWAAYVLRQIHPVIIGVVGNLGKTTVCEAISTALASRHAVYSSARTHGGPFSLAVDLSGLEPYHRFAVLELSPDEYTSLRDMISILQPQVVVLTSSMSRGADRLSLGAGTAEPLLDVLREMPPRSAIVASVSDRELLAPAGASLPRVLTYGDSESAQLANVQLDAAAEDVRFGVDGTTLNLRLGKDHVKDVRLQGIGSPSVTTALCALAACAALDVTIRDALPALAQMEGLGGLRVTPGPAGSILVDASSGAQPETVLAVLEWLDGQKAQVRRKLLVMGDFEPAGDALVEACHWIGRRAAPVIDAIIACDEDASPAVLASRRAGLAARSTFLPRQREEAIAFLRSQLGRGDLVVVAGKHVASTEAVVSSLSPQPGEVARTPGPAGTSGAIRTPPPERSWLEIDLRALASNVRLIKRQLENGVQLMAVVRDNGFHQGAVEVASTALRNGATLLAVSTTREGLSLREAGFECPILVMGHTPADSLPLALRARLTVTIHGPTSAELVTHCARRMKTVARCHLRVASSARDSGVSMRDAIALVRHLEKTDQILLEGLFMEFSPIPGQSWGGDSARQLQQFTQIARNLSAAGVEVAHVHAAGSAAMLSIPGSVFSVARIGHLMVGVSPFPTLPLPQGLTPTLSWRTTIIDLVRDQPKGSSGGEARRLAVIPVGYRDGLIRDQRSHGGVLIGGVRATITDLVGPGWSCVDVSAAPSAYVGDEATLIGRQGNDRITVEEIAAQRNCASDDVLASLPASLPRQYVQ